MRLTLHQEPNYCEACPLYRVKKNRTRYIPTDVVYDRVSEDGTPKVDIMIVGEPPTRTEDSLGMPFAGAPGREMANALKKSGLEGSYALANVVRCVPRDEDGNNRPPSMEEIAACSNYIKQDIKALDPKVLVVMGNQALNVLNENPEWVGKSAGKLRGQAFLADDGKTHLVTLHPSSYIRSESATQRRKFLRHMKSAGRFVSGEQTAFSSRGEVELVDTIERFDTLMDWYQTKCKTYVALDYETENLNHVARNRVATVQLSPDNDLSHVIPLQHPDSPWNKKELKHVRKRLRRLLGSKKTKIPFWLMHNAQFDGGISFNFLRIKSIAKPVIDTMFLAFLQDENLCGDTEDGAKTAVFGSFALKTLARELLGYYLYDTELSDALAARGGARGGSLWNLPLDRLSEYGGADAYVTRRLFDYYSAWLEKQNYSSAIPFASKFFSRVFHLLTKMTINGFPVDTDQLEYLKSEDSPIISRIEKIPGLIAAMPQAKKANKLLLEKDPKTAGMSPLFGKDPWVFDLRKKSHMLRLFVDVCELEPLSYTKKEEPQLNKPYWDFYKEHPLIKLYQEYKGLDKLKTSYLNSVTEALISHPDNVHDGRIHARFHATRTVTGRLACLPDGTRLATGRGLVPIEEVQKGDVIQTDYGTQKVRSVCEAGSKEILEFTLDNGRTLKCSNLHQVFSNGEWETAENIKVGDTFYVSGRKGPDVLEGSSPLMPEEASRLGYAASLTHSIEKTQVPDVVFRSSLEAREAFLSSLLTEEHETDTESLTTTSSALAQGVSTLWASLGVHHSWTKDSDVHCLTSLNTVVCEENGAPHFDSWSKQAKAQSTVVVGIRSLGEHCVYDLEVPTTESFLVNGIVVHNSSNPNLQQLPKGEYNDAKAAIRSIYGASPGHMLVECDFGQAEVRWWSQISGDKQYAKLFQEMKDQRDEYKRTGDEALGKKVRAEADIHKKVASIMFHKSVYDVSKSDRKRAKALCVSKGTWVRTGKGMQRIEDVISYFSPGTCVESSVGVEEVCNTFSLKVDKTLSVTSGRGYSLSGRPEHPILVWRDTKLCYVELQDLVLSDHIVIRRGSSFLPNNCEDSSRLSRLSGYLVAKGSCTGYSLHFTSTSDVLFDDFMSLTSDFTSDTSERYYSLSDKKSFRVVTINKEPTDWLKSNGWVSSETSHNKSIPSSVLKGGRKDLIEFLRGYWAGDGTVTENVASATTASPVLAEQLHLILCDLGIISRRWKRSGKYWVVDITGKDLDAFLSICPPIKPQPLRNKKWSNSKVELIPGLSSRLSSLRGTPGPSLGKNYKKNVTTSYLIKNKDWLLPSLDVRDKTLSEDLTVILNRDWFLDSISTISVKESADQEVYDFTIPGSHSFITNGIISHNCFGSMFGQHSTTLASILGISKDEAIKLQDTFVLEFEKAGRWLTDIELEAVLRGVVSTPMGRLRHLADIIEKDENGGKRKARNSPIQAASSDTTALCSWRIQNWIEKNDRPFKVINCVHDAVTLEIPLDFEMLKEAVWLMQHMMVDTVDEFLLEEFGIKMIVPMEVDFDIGVRWGHMIGYDGYPPHLRPAFDRCVEWDRKLKEGIRWHTIATEEFSEPIKEAS